MALGERTRHGVQNRADSKFSIFQYQLGIALGQTRDQFRSRHLPQRRTVGGEFIAPDGVQLGIGLHALARLLFRRVELGPQQRTKVGRAACSTALGGNALHRLGGLNIVLGLDR